MREAFKAEVISELKNRKSVLVLGARGSGRSYLLGSIVADLERAIYVPRIGGAKKQLLLDLARTLHADENLPEDLAHYAYYPDFEDARKELNKLSIADLTVLLTPALSHYVIAIDELHAATEKSIKDVVLPLLKANVTLLLAGDDSSKTRAERLSLARNKCVALNIPPLGQDEARALLWQRLKKSEYPHWRAIESKVLNLHGGLPGVVVDLAAQLDGKPGMDAVRNLRHTDTKRYDLTFLTILFILAVGMSMRYIGRGFDDPSIVIISGVAYALMVVSRPLMFQMTR